MDINKLVNMLGLTRPIIVKLSHKSHSGVCAEYWPKYRGEKLRRHIIEIFLPELASDTRTFETIIAHELIHAWQEENGKTEIHGKHFAKMANKITAHFGYRGIFDPEIDNP